MDERNFVTVDRAALREALLEAGVPYDGVDAAIDALVIPSRAVPAAMSDLRQGFVVRLPDRELAVVTEHPTGSTVAVSRSGLLRDVESVDGSSLALVFPEDVGAALARQGAVVVEPGGGLDGRDRRDRAEVGVLLDLALKVERRDAAGRQVYTLVSELYQEIKRDIIAGQDPADYARRPIPPFGESFGD